MDSLSIYLLFIVVGMIVGGSIAAGIFRSLLNRQQQQPFAYVQQPYQQQPSAFSGLFYTLIFIGSLMFLLYIKSSKTHVYQPPFPAQQELVDYHGH
ncbi:MAG: hypothetical protein AAF798_17365 [Bacteroidota bacterium]